MTNLTKRLTDFKELRFIHKRLRKTRIHSRERQNEITKQTIESFEKAKREGKFKVVGDRKIFYDTSE